MRCSEIREHLIDFVYDEGASAPASAEMQEHLCSCAACREELEELRQTRKYLQRWKEEPPQRHVTIPVQQAVPHRASSWRYLRYAAIAAMAAICFLALANTQITWDKNGFSFRTRLLAASNADRNYYTKTEIRNLMKQALDESEFHMNETSYLMMSKILDKVEQDRWMDLRLIRGRAAQSRNGN
jgi:hypothetical protein